MEDGTAPPGARQLLASDPTIAKKLLGYTHKRVHRDVHRAREVAQEAILLVLEGKGWHRWKPEGKSLLNHLSNVVDSLVANEDRSAAAWREEQTVDGVLPDGAPDASRTPEQRVGHEADLDHELALAARVQARVADDPILPRLLEHQEDGVDKPSELAALLRCSVNEIHAARKRLAIHVDKVLKEDRQEQLRQQVQRRRASKDKAISQ